MGANQRTYALLGALLGSFVALQAGAVPITVTKTNSTEAIVDESSTTRSVNIPDHGAITGVTVVLDFMKCDDPLSLPLPASCTGTGLSYEDEIVFRLTSPLGSQIALVDGTYTTNSAPGQRVTVTFSDAGTDIAGNTNGLVTETAKALQFFSLLNGQDPFGNWDLFVEDTGLEDPLGLASFTLNVTFEPRLPVGTAPEPATLFMFGLGLAGLAALRRRG